MPSEAVIDKAARLLAEERVEPTDGALVFEVRGDTETYWPVVVSEDRRFCPCPAQGSCSHVMAAESWRLSYEPAPEIPNVPVPPFPTIRQEGR